MTEKCRLMNYESWLRAAMSSLLLPELKITLSLPSNLQPTKLPITLWVKIVLISRNRYKNASRSLYMNDGYLPNSDIARGHLKHGICTLIIGLRTTVHGLNLSGNCYVQSYQMLSGPSNRTGGSTRNISCNSSKGLMHCSTA